MSWVFALFSPSSRPIRTFVSAYCPAKSPVSQCRTGLTETMGRPTGLEPATPGFTILCSNQLSYDRRKMRSAKVREPRRECQSLLPSFALLLHRKFFHGAQCITAVHLRRKRSTTTGDTTGEIGLNWLDGIRHADSMGSCGITGSSNQWDTSEFAGGTKNRLNGRRYLAGGDPPRLISRSVY